MHQGLSTGGHPSQVLLRLSVLLGFTAGFSLGVVLLLAQVTGQATALPWTALTQIHGQIQIVGFVGLFILGTASQLLPGFLARPLEHRSRLVLGGALIAAGLVLRALSQPFAASPVRAIALGLSGIGELAGLVLCLAVYAQLLRRSIQPRELWRTIVALGFGCLVLSLIVNLVAVGALIDGSDVVPWSLDAALIQLELWGFAVPIVFGVSRKILPRFLLLPAPNDCGLRWSILGYLGGVALIFVGWLTSAVLPVSPVGRDLRVVGAWGQFVGGVALVWFLRLGRRPVRPSGAPEVTEPFRRWIYSAFAWLLLANALAAIWAVRTLLGGPEASFFELTAERHALAQGFLLSVIVAFGARILPGYSAWAIRHPRLVEASFGCVTIGTLLRVLGESGAGAAPMAGAAAGAGGTLGTLGFILFALPLITSQAQPVAAPRRNPKPTRERLAPSDRGS